ncbi:MAG: BrnT family toxin [Bacteroidota bacterium]
MEFEYDHNKSLSNLKKHGIDFEESKTLWEDQNALVFQSKQRNEMRFLTIGLIKGKHWSAISTIRGDKIRIISVRRSRKKEIQLYENY